MRPRLATDVNGCCRRTRTPCLTRSPLRPTMNALHARHPCALDSSVCPAIAGLYNSRRRHPADQFMYAADDLPPT